MNNLAKYRGKHNLTQEELGKMVGLPKASISYIEKHTLSAKAAVKYGNVMNENPFDLLGSDALVMLPKTEEEKEILIEMIRGL